MPDPMLRYHRQFGTFLDELFDSVVERRPMRRFCDDCGERMATETWDYGHAPIPNPPAPEHLCSACADSRRDSDTERKMEG